MPIRTGCASAWVTMTSTGRTARFSRPRRSVTQTGRKAMSGWSALDGTTWSSGIK
ncbi:MAG: hypothetical protein ACLTE0_07470 [Coprococcus phoceensis]|uniref:hypothetical protein n=1 Tax=Eubacterium sp. TaxID=142586 RepID=UPI0012F4ADF3